MKIEDEDDTEPPDVIDWNEVERFCGGCGADLIGNDPCDPECPTLSTAVVVKEQWIGECVDCGEPCDHNLRRCQWCAALKHLA